MLNDQEKQQQIETHQLDQAKFDQFYQILVEQYRDLFANDPNYSYSASQISPENLAHKMTIGLAAGTANKDGEGIKRTCKQLAISHTYKAIRLFLGVK